MKMERNQGAPERLIAEGQELDSFWNQRAITFQKKAEKRSIFLGLSGHVNGKISIGKNPDDYRLTGFGNISKILKAKALN
jgi:hypothetical protein